MADKAKLRNLKIKTGVVKRYTSEKKGYEKEIETQKGKIEKFKAEGRDEYFMKQQNECLRESEMMVPDIQRRLLAACEELKLLISGEDAKEFTGTEEMKGALQVLEDAKDHLPEFP